MHRSKQHRHSITSSARGSSDFGTSTPRADCRQLVREGHDANLAAIVEQQRIREQKGQDEERRGFDNAGRNTMPSESKRFSGTTVLLSVESCIFRTIGKYAPRRWFR
jgi:hypothetical protein